MSRSGEAAIELHDNHDDFECWAHHQRAGAESAVDEVVRYINDGIITEEEVERTLRGQRES